MPRTPLINEASPAATVLEDPLNPSADASFRHEMGHISRTGLDPDDRLILGAIWFRAGGKFNFLGGKA